MKIVLLLAAVVLIAWVFYSKRKPLVSTKTTAKTPLNASTTTQYKCVVIEPGLVACKQAEAMKDKKILRDHAPVLPLAGCHLGQCDCKFIRYDDRRTDERRNESYVARSVYVDDHDKRAKTERRKKT
jgi:hypothetical protein